jgi:isoquinoline 1-oxidoreductase beta subunit
VRTTVIRPPRGLTRRGFLIATAGAAAAGAGLAVGYRPLRAYYDGPVGNVAGAVPVGDWVHIAADGTVTVLTTVVEMGQGSQSAIAQIVAEELDLRWDQVRVQMTPLSRRYSYRGFATEGSSAIRESFDTMRRTGAAARALMVRVAARRWAVDESSCTTEAGRVLHAVSGRSFGYGELAEAAAAVGPPQDPPIKARRQWTIIGQSVPRLDTASKCDGSAVFGSDVQLPKLVHVAILQPPCFGQRLQRVEAGPADRVPGVRKVVSGKDFVAVAADTYWAASQGLAALRPQWSARAAGASDTATLTLRLREAVDASAATSAPTTPERSGEVERSALAFRGAARVVERTYEVPLLAQAPLEPLGATAEVTADGAVLHVSTQDLGGMRSAVAEALGLRRAQVEIRCPFVGGGFGRRLGTEYGVQAALISREVGLPVKVLWSREEEMRHGAYRPAAACRLRAGISMAGELVALEAHLAVLGDRKRAAVFANLPYAISATLVTCVPVATDIPLGAWRSVDASQNCYFLEAFLDEVAAEIAVNPFDLRLRLLRHDRRATRVLETVAREAGWGSPVGAGTGRGISFLKGFGSLVAQVCEVAVKPDREVALTRVVSAVDCGTAINPASIRAQFEGGAVFALSAATRGQITVQNGAVVEGNFDSYPLLTIAETPDIETHVLETDSAPVGGIGEAPVPGIAPALVNAIAAATGTRIRSLPFTRSGFRLGPSRS